MHGPDIYEPNPNRRRPTLWSALKRRWRRFWFNWLAGNRYYFDEPKDYITQKWRERNRTIKTILLWLSAIFVCRFKKHVIDGRESGGAPGCYRVDAWCSRCFYAYFQIVPDEAPWLKERHNALVREAKKAFEDPEALLP